MPQTDRQTDRQFGRKTHRRSLPCVAGTHHAHHAHGSGFTILNDLAVTAAWARREAGVERVAIIDLDVHQGDGTASIFAEVPEVTLYTPS